MLSWISYWRFTKKPFDREHARFLAAFGRIEVVEAIQSECDRNPPLLFIHGASGMGVSTVWREVIRRAKSPYRRILVATARGDRLALYRELASGLGVSTPRSMIEQDLCQALADGLKTALRQGLSVLIAIDDAQTLGDDPRTFQRLQSLTNARIQLLVAGHCPTFDKSLRFEVHALTHSEAIVFLDLKFREAGRDISLFHPKALARLQCETRGVPAVLEIMAEQALRLAASQGAESVSSAVVEQISQDQTFAGWRPDWLVG